MNNLFVPYEIALKLKELGFNERCFKYWNIFPQAVQNKYQLDDNIDDWSHDTIKAPIYQQVIDWFREKHNYSIEVYYRNSDHTFFGIIYPIAPKTEVNFGKGQFKTHREALNKAIEEAIKLINA